MRFKFVFLLFYVFFLLLHLLMNAHRANLSLVTRDSRYSPSPSLSAGLACTPPYTWWPLALFSAVSGCHPCDHQPPQPLNCVKTLPDRLQNAETSRSESKDKLGSARQGRENGTERNEASEANCARLVQSSALWVATVGSAGQVIRLGNGNENALGLQSRRRASKGQAGSEGRGGKGSIRCWLLAATCGLTRLCSAWPGPAWDTTLCGSVTEPGL